MFMSLIIVNPSDLRRFASFLREKTVSVRSKSKKLSLLLSNAKQTWKDEKYRRFHDDLSAISCELDKLSNLAESYTKYLEMKANKAQKYLDRR